MNFLRIICFSFIGFLLLIGISIAIGIVVPAPAIEWASSPAYLHDTRTGVNYPLQQLWRDSAGTIISGVQLVPSPEDSYVMTLTNKPTGFDIQVADANGVNLLGLHTEPEGNINNALWITDNEFLLLRVIFPSGDLQVRRLDVATGGEAEIARVDSNLFIVSPHNQWILLNDSASESSRVINTLDGRTHDVERVSRSYAWSDDERYFASGTFLEGGAIFQLLDTTTGHRLTEPFIPMRFVWSSNNRDLIVQGEDEILLYRDMQPVGQGQWQFQNQIEQMMWSSNGELAWIIIEANDNYDVYLVDIDTEQQVQHVATIPTSADILTFAWALDKPIVTYNVFDSQRNFTDVYHVHMLTGELDHLTRLPDRIGQVRYLKNLILEEYRP